MTSTLKQRIATRTSAPTADDGSAIRLTLKPEAPTTGYVDGAWWPRSRDLAEELQGLVAALTDRVGRVERVSYNLNSWAHAGRRIVATGTTVRLQGYNLLHTNVVDVRGERARLRLLVVSPDASESAGTAALTAASESGSIAKVDDLIALK